MKEFESIKQFIDGRSICPLCNLDLEMSITCSYVFSPINIRLEGDLLFISHKYFNYDIDIVNNIVSRGKDDRHWEFKLSLFCPVHTNTKSERYKYELIFDLYNGRVANETPHEILKTESFILTSLPYQNKIDYTNLITGTHVNFPYFDYSSMSLSKLKDKLKTYLLMQ